MGLLRRHACTCPGQLPTTCRGGFCRGAHTCKSGCREQAWLGPTAPLAAAEAQVDTLSYDGGISSARAGVWGWPRRPVMWRNRRGAPRAIAGPAADSPARPRLEPRRMRAIVDDVLQQAGRRSQAGCCSTAWMRSHPRRMVHRRFPPTEWHVCCLLPLHKEAGRSKRALRQHRQRQVRGVLGMKEGKPPVSGRQAMWWRVQEACGACLVQSRGISRPGWGKSGDSGQGTQRGRRGAAKNWR